MSSVSLRKVIFCFQILYFIISNNIIESSTYFSECQTHIVNVSVVWEDVDVVQTEDTEDTEVEVTEVTGCCYRREVWVTVPCNTRHNSPSPALLARDTASDEMIHR